MANTRAVGLSRNKISDITQLVRSLFGLEEILYFPVIQCIEVMAADDSVDFNYELVEPSEFSNTYATTNTEENVMYIRSDVYDRAKEGSPRDRFTLCHELGHYFLHRPGTIGNARGEIPKYCEPEWQANTFAGELLAPRNLVGGMTPEEISEKCGMSYTAASIQYKYANKNVNRDVKGKPIT